MFVVPVVVVVAGGGGGGGGGGGVHDAIYLGWMLIDAAQWLEMDQNKSDFRKNQLEFPNMFLSCH